jgi:hypothetical protein
MPPLFSLGHMGGLLPPCCQCINEMRVTLALGMKARGDIEAECEQRKGCCVWMEVLALVSSKLTPKLILWSQTHVLVWC